MLLLCGCSSTNSVDKETYDLFVTYQQKIGVTCLKYIENDSKLSSREKNTIKNFNRLYIRKLSELKVIK